MQMYIHQKNLELHETAHAIDKNVLNKKSNSEEFMEVFAQERYKLYDPKQVAHAYISKFIEEFLQNHLCIIILMKIQIL